MKFFTRSLLEMADSVDAGTAQWAHDEWERISGDYLRHLQQIETQAPRPVRELARMNLHDARMINWGQCLRERRLFILLQAEGGEVVLLHYHISKGCDFIRDQDPSTWQEPLEWLYDELDAEIQNGVTTYRHSILFTNGVELHVYFHEVDVEKYASLESVGRATSEEAFCRT